MTVEDLTVLKVRTKIKIYKDTRYYVDDNNRAKVQGKLLEKFLKKFTKSTINSLTRENYCYGNRNSDSFCYWVEQILDHFGSLKGKPSPVVKYGICWSDKVGRYIFTSEQMKTNKFGKTAEEVLDNIKTALIDLIDATERDDEKAITDNLLTNTFKQKLTFLYNNKNQMPIYSEEHLKILLDIFGLHYDDTTSTYAKRKLLYKYYKNNFADLLQSPTLFMSFIYNTYGYRNDLYRKIKPVVSIETANTIDMVEVELKETPKTANKKGVKRGLVKHDPFKELAKYEIGKKAENIVFNFLNSHKDSLGIVELKKWFEEDDFIGYDISYKTSDGRETYIEVKGTITGSIDDVHFEMSSNEYNVMLANKDNYFICFVNLNNADKILKISASDAIKHLEPSKYKTSCAIKTTASSDETIVADEESKAWK